jgi:dipeptidyl aminopeptidase/acylaminoacyl peptidase
MANTKKRMIQADDVFNIVVLESLQWHPQGHEIAFVQLKANQVSNDYQRTIWRWQEGWAEPRQFTNGGKMDFSPAYSPDGERMAFVSTRGDKPQVYLIRTDGGEAKQLTNMPNGVSGFSWSPDGKHITFVSPLNAEERRLEKRGKFPPPPPKDSLEGELRKVEQDHQEKEMVDPRVYKGLPFKAGTEFVSDRYNHIFLLEVDAEGDDARPRRLTDGDADFSPPRWSPNGRYLWSASTRRPTQDRFSESDIVRITVRDGAVKRMERPGYYGAQPKPSPDGNWVAGVTTLNKENFGHIMRLTVFKSNGSGWRDLNLALDRSVGAYAYIYQFEWAADSQGLYYTIEDSGYSKVYYVNLESGEFISVAGKDELVQLISVNAAGDVAYISRTATHPPELYLARKGKKPTRLTKIHDKWLDEVQVAATKEIRYQAPDGQEIQGWIVSPPDFDPKQKWPLALNIHGGPHVMWSPAAHAMWLEWQMHAARGYVVFYCNPRGSDGYGNDFRTFIHDSWGEADMDDILSGVDAVVAQGYIDEKRMAVTGGSYGGFMTVWIVGHDQRFAAAVSQRGVYNLMSFYGTSDIPVLIEGEFDVMAFDDPDKMWKYSPFSYVRQMRTPMLIIHSDNDYRVPIADGEQLFTALKRLRRTVEFVRYPREGHELSRSGEPKHRIDRLERMTAWFDRYCKPRKVKK